MTPDELRLIKQQLAPWVDRGEISQATMKEIAELTKDKPKTPVTTCRLKEEVVSRQEAAQILGVSVRSIIRWGKMGKLRCTKLANERLTRYRLSDIQKLINTIDED